MFGWPTVEKGPIQEPRRQELRKPASAEVLAWRWSAELRRDELAEAMDGSHRATLPDKPTAGRESDDAAVVAAKTAKVAEAGVLWMNTPNWNPVDVVGDRPFRGTGRSPGAEIPSSGVHRLRSQF